MRKVTYDLNKFLIDNFFPEIRKNMDSGVDAFILPKEYVEVRTAILKELAKLDPTLIGNE